MRIVPGKSNSKDWEPFFAILPVTTNDGSIVFMEWVERRWSDHLFHDIDVLGSLYSVAGWEYRAK